MLDRTTQKHRSRFNRIQPAGLALGTVTEMQYLKSHAIIGSSKKNLQFPNEHLEMGTSWNWSKVLLILFGLLNEPEINYLPLFSQALDY